MRPYQGVKVRPARPGEIEQIRATVEKIKARRDARTEAEERLRGHKGIIDGLTDEQLKALSEMPEPAVMCGKMPNVR